MFDFNVNNKREDQLPLGTDFPQLLVLGLLSIFKFSCSFWSPAVVKSNPTYMKVFKISAHLRSHDIFCNPRQNSSQNLYPPSYSPLNEDRELTGAWRISGNAVMGRRFRQDLGKKERRMLDGLSAVKSLGLDGAVTRNEQTLEWEGCSSKGLWYMRRMTGKWSVRRVLRNKRGLQVEVIGGSDTGQGSPFVFRNIIVLH